MRGGFFLAAKERWHWKRIEDAGPPGAIGVYVSLSLWIYPTLCPLVAGAASVPSKLAHPQCVNSFETIRPWCVRIPLRAVA